MRVSTSDAFGLLFLRLPEGEDLEHYYAALRKAAPLLQSEAWQRAVSGYYVNCARRNQLRISYFTRAGDVAREVAATFVGTSGLELARAPELPAPLEVSAAYGGEEARFRRFLVTYAPIALDAMLADLLHARRLVATLRFQVTRPRGDARAHLEPTFLAQSAFYRALGARERAHFWRDLGHWPNPPQVDWAHMLVNMVIGFDWPPGEFLAPSPALAPAEINARLARCAGALTIPAQWTPMPAARGMRIRRAGAADADDLATLGARTFAAAFGADNRPEDMQAYLASAFDRDSIAAELADPAVTYLIAEDDDEVVGYAMLRHGRAPEPVARERTIELVRIYAAAERIGRGYGSALMQACLDEAGRGGCASIWLGVWERNERAIAFYRRWKFEVVGAHEFVLGRDVQNDLIMSRPLEPAH